MLTAPQIVEKHQKEDTKYLGCLDSINCRKKNKKILNCTKREKVMRPLLMEQSTKMQLRQTKQPHIYFRGYKNKITFKFVCCS